MKKMLFYSIIVISGILYFSCSKDDTACTEAPVASSFEPLYPNDGAWNCRVKVSDTARTVFYTLKSVTDYKRYVVGTLTISDVISDTIPVVDFTKKSVIAGRYISKYADKVRSMSVEKACDTYSLTVNIGGSARLQATNVYFFAVVDVTGADAKVNVVSEH